MNHHCDIQIQACTTEDTRGLWGPNINRLQWGNFNKQIFLFNFFYGNADVNGTNHQCGL
jgi:hypothetical protein